MTIYIEGCVLTSLNGAMSRYTIFSYNHNHFASWSFQEISYLYYQKFLYI